MSPKQLCLIRHAQGYHNLNLEGHNIHDPTLTTEGERQCKKLASQLVDMDKIDCIVASPLKRTLDTALVTFRSLLDSKPDLRIIALPELQETANMPCDTGSSVAELRREFPKEPLDLSLVGESWTDKSSGPFSPRSKDVAERCRKARCFLRQLDAENVAVVAHGAVLHYLTDDWQGATSGVGTGWANAESRVYQFDESSEQSVAGAMLVETDDSRAARTLTEHRLPPAAQAALKKEAEKMWVTQGFITLDNGVKEGESDS
ncbi:phosphoglycerate mutase-like protein [Dothidotthia symphoricarpi CBS 119687]|uniref:Phosphoglycerate mutase-like protein n=1 Tax=Dothidotthia symphoricarpi CBS 119687 TaxID=1392245 RepID=A0A6A6AFA7_9PLEO|nr:phosphoglycerate mutase-like protein [Dothidotthia symphoricarpi CBS 119687]KAF2130470.1 phosphoglycerate mutase-like protein [Dothidotthia symphoricarpi CBS 119687]